MRRGGFPAAGFAGFAFSLRNGRRSFSPISTGLGAVVALAMVGCVSPSAPTREPANLYPHKLELRAYVESGRYQRDIAAVAGQIQRWLEQRATRRTPHEKLAVVFDLDETLLSNWPYLRKNDFGYLPDEWTRWVDAAQAPAIEPVREVFRIARRLNFEVIFVTGRTESQRAATEKNVRAIDCGEFVVLACRPDEASGTSAAFKTAVRERLTKEGWTIVANIGDQESDLVGGFAERTFKLPNPFYLTE